MAKTRISKTVKTTSSEVWKVGEYDINVNYDCQSGKTPDYVNANCTLPKDPAANPAVYVQPVTINVSRQANGIKSASINGDVDTASVSSLIEDMKAILDEIVAEGSAA